jgi:hypothetical protein
MSLTKMISVRLEPRHEQALAAIRLPHETTSDTVRRVLYEYAAAVAPTEWGPEAPLPSD